ncbi:hypothetical protein EZV62_009297 [Acer yangbiense]|uniref:fructose-bisphosphate aldolase n=1 Tax=Acer yangbiense TaxID=1000413 RepID=A0A5C7IGS8_9ROSI|nr:hypothetical protein EZV62_009297 [Acer yangbiense]
MKTGSTDFPSSLKAYCGEGSVISVLDIFSPRLPKISKMDKGYGSSPQDSEKNFKPANRSKVAPEVIAEYTVTALHQTVPLAVLGIVFLSGGQSEEEAKVNLDAMNKLEVLKPWTLAFSFKRAIQQRTLKTWGGKKENVAQAQEAFLARCKANSEATLSKYTSGGARGLASESLYVKGYKYRMWFMCLYIYIRVETT